MKECNKCKEVKELTEFHKDKANKSGFRGECKVCKSVLQKKHRLENPSHYDYRKEYNKKYRVKNKEKLNMATKKWRLDNPEKSKDSNIRWLLKNPVRAKATKKAYCLINKEEIAKKRAKYRRENKEKLAAQNKKWRDANPEYYDKIKDEKNKRVRERRVSDPLFKLRQTLRTRSLMAFKSKGWVKYNKTMEMLGVSIETAKAYLERQFTNGMTWENQGEWHIDHIIPLSSAKDEEALRKLCHYTNLQPLWAIDNLKKGDKIVETQIKLRI